MKNPVTSQLFTKQFRCIGAECPDTCCQGWNMQVDNKTRDLYSRTGPELLDSVSGKPGEYIMKRDVKTDFCVKFSDGLCGIQKKYGEDYLGDACYFYPRVTRALGSRVIMTAALSCPEIARLALFDDAAFAFVEHDAAKLPSDVKNYLPASIPEEKAMEIHQRFLEACLDSSVSAERSLMRMLVTCESMERISISSWPDAVPFYLSHADSGLPAPEGKDTDTVYLLQALCGLITAAKKVHSTRLMQTVKQMEQALHVTIHMDTLVIASLPDSAGAIQTLVEKWRSEHEAAYAPLLRRYLAMQIALSLFPFSGFGHNLTERIAIIGIRLATVKLALMSACAVHASPLAQSEIIQVVESLSRFLDHLAEPDFSLKIYQETGWLKKARLRALLGDRD